MILSDTYYFNNFSVFPELPWKNDGINFLSQFVFTNCQHVSSQTLLSSKKKGKHPFLEEDKKREFTLHTLKFCKAKDEKLYYLVLQYVWGFQNSSHRQSGEIKCCLFKALPKILKLCILFFPFAVIKFAFVPFAITLSKNISDIETAINS